MPQWTQGWNMPVTILFWSFLPTHCLWSDLYSKLAVQSDWVLMEETNLSLCSRLLVFCGGFLFCRLLIFCFLGICNFFFPTRGFFHLMPTAFFPLFPILGFRPDTLLQLVELPYSTTIFAGQQILFPSPLYFWFRRQKVVPHSFMVRCFAS